MANELKIASKVVFLSGQPITLPAVASDPGTAVNGDMYYNTASDEVRLYKAGSWTFIPSGISIAAGSAGQLSLYPAAGSTLSPTYVQNSQNINLSIAAQPARSVGLVYTIPNPGDAIAAANFVLTEGNQTISGTKSFAGSMKITFVSTLLPLQVDGVNTVISAPIDLTTQVSGVLPIISGGTNSGSPLNNSRLIYSFGGAIVEYGAITANKALASDVSGLPVASTTSDAELAFLSGVTSSVQTQINSKVSKTGDAMTGDLTFSSTNGIQNTIGGSILTIGTTSNTSIINIGAATTTINIGTAGSNIFAFNHFLPGVDNTTDIGSATFRWANIRTLNAILYGSTSGTITHKAADTTTPYSIKWPSAQGVANSTIQNDGSGNLIWTTSVSPFVPSWTKYTFTFSSFSTAALTNSITLFSLPAKGMIHQIVIKHSTAFSGGAIATYTVSVGDGSNDIRFAAAFDVFQATSDTARSITQDDEIESFSSPTTITITATSTGANLNAAAAGSVDVWVLTSTLT